MRSVTSSSSDPEVPMSDPLQTAAIRDVHILRTGSGHQHREHRVGSRWPRMIWALFSTSWVESPVQMFVIDHRDGLVLFDAGLDPAIATDRHYVSSAIGRFFLHRLFRIEVGPDDALPQKLESLGFAASAVKTVVVSHLHFDHVGGIATVPQAELLVSEAEWSQLSDPHPERDFILREHIEQPGARWRPISFTPTDDPVLAHFDGVYDVAGDRSMVLVPTPGHTRGSMSMLVRTAGLAPLLLVGDLTYEVDLLLRDQVPGTGDADQLRDSFAKVRRLREHLPDLAILPCHDGSAVEALARSWDTRS